MYHFELKRKHHEEDELPEGIGNYLITHFAGVRKSAGNRNEFKASSETLQGHQKDGESPPAPFHGPHGKPAIVHRMRFCSAQDIEILYVVARKCSELAPAHALFRRRMLAYRRNRLYAARSRWAPCTGSITRLEVTSSVSSSAIIGSICCYLAAPRRCHPSSSTHTRDPRRYRKFVAPTSSYTDEVAPRLPPAWGWQLVYQPSAPKKKAHNLPQRARCE